MTVQPDVGQPRLLEPEDFPEAVVGGLDSFADFLGKQPFLGKPEFLGKPRARGWIHVYAAIVAVIAGAALVSVSWAVDSTRAGIATLIYTLTVVAMFTVSGTYHRVHWKSQPKHRCLFVSCT